MSQVYPPPAAGAVPLRSLPSPEGPIKGASNGHDFEVLSESDIGSLQPHDVDLSQAKPPSLGEKQLVANPQLAGARRLDEEVVEGGPSLNEGDVVRPEGTEEGSVPVANDFPPDTRGDSPVEEGMPIPEKAGDSSTLVEEEPENMFLALMEGDSPAEAVLEVEEKRAQDESAISPHEPAISPQVEERDPQIEQEEADEFLSLQRQASEPDEHIDENSLPGASPQSGVEAPVIGKVAGAKVSIVDPAWISKIAMQRAWAKASQNLEFQTLLQTYPDSKAARQARAMQEEHKGREYEGAGFSFTYYPASREIIFEGDEQAIDAVVNDPERNMPEEWVAIILESKKMGLIARLTKEQKKHIDEESDRLATQLIQHFRDEIEKELRGKEEEKKPTALRTPNDTTSAKAQSKEARAPIVQPRKSLKDVRSKDRKDQKKIDDAIDEEYRARKKEDVKAQMAKAQSVYEKRKRYFAQRDIAYTVEKDAEHKKEEEIEK